MSNTPCLMNRMNRRSMLKSTVTGIAAFGAGIALVIPRKPVRRPR